MKKILILFFALMPISMVFAQLTDRETTLLATKVRNNYEEYGIEGAKVYRTSKHRTLVSVVTVTSDMQPAQVARLAQVKASHSAVEFLKGAINSSISVYDAFSNDETSLTERNGSDVNQKGSPISYSTSTSAKELTIVAGHETMSDKIIQSSIAHIDGLQPLLKFTGADGEMVYAYYMVINKKTAKKKR